MVPPHLRFIGLAGSTVVFIGSKAAETVSDTSNAQGFALAAIISAVGAALVGILGAVTNMIVKLRRVEKTRPRRRTRAQLLRELAALDDGEGQP